MMTFTDQITMKLNHRLESIDLKRSLWWRIPFDRSGLLGKFMAQKLNGQQTIRFTDRSGSIQDRNQN